MLCVAAKGISANEYLVLAYDLLVLVIDLVVCSSSPQKASVGERFFATCSSLWPSSSSYWPICVFQLPPEGERGWAVLRQSRLLLLHEEDEEEAEPDCWPLPQALTTTGWWGALFVCHHNNYCEIMFIRWTFNCVSFVGRSIYEFKIPANYFFTVVILC